MRPKPSTQTPEVISGGSLHMKQQRVWLIGSMVLFGIWMCAMAVMWFARAQKMTVEKVTAYISTHSLKSMSQIERMRTIEDLARRVNQLDFEERQKFRFEKKLRLTYEEMTDAEKSRYLDMTLPAGMRQMMEAFNNMTPEKRKKLVNRAVTELTRAQNEASQEELDKVLNDQNLIRVIDQGLKAYMSEANAASKLEIQPLIEQMQAMMHGAH